MDHLPDLSPIYEDELKRLLSAVHNHSATEYMHTHADSLSHLLQSTIQFFITLPISYIHITWKTLSKYRTVCDGSQLHILRYQKVQKGEKVT